MAVKVKKIIRSVLALLCVLLAVLLCIFLFWLGPTVKLVAEKVGSNALGTPLTIGELSINPRNGTLHLTDFRIANPSEFGRTNSVSLTSLDIAIDMGSLFTRTVVVHQVEINSPYFTYEQSSATDNITEFIQNIQEFIGFDPSAPPPPPDPKELEKERQKKEKKALKKIEKGPKVVVVESLAINDAQTHLANTDDNLLDFNAGFEQLSVSMTNGIAQLDNFYVRNPGRLETTNLFSLEQFQLLLEPGPIYSTNINIHAVNIRKPHLFIEHNPKTDTLGEFLKIASGLAAKIPTNTPNASLTNAVAVAEDESVEPPSPPPEVTLGTLTIDDVQFHVVNVGDPDLNVYLGLNRLGVALDQGSAHLDHLFITNPGKLDTPNLFSLDGITADFEAGSLKTGTLVIKDVQVKKPTVSLELNKVANTTGEFMKIANGFIERIPTYSIPQIPRPAAGTETGQHDVEPHTTDEPAAPPIQLHNLLVDDIQVKLLDTTATNNLPDEPHPIAGIGAVSVKLVDGTIQIRDIRIPNVEGFTATNILHLANIDIAIDPASLFSGQVNIKQVFVNGPEVNLEQTEHSGNVAVLQHTLMKFAPPDTKLSESAPVAEEPEGSSEPEEAGEPVPLDEQPVVLHQLVITNLSVKLKLPASTNEPATGPMGKLELGKLNPMRNESLNKLNPLSGGSGNAQEVDPHAPLTVVAFKRLSLEPLKGLLCIDDLHISNPPEFSHNDLVNIEQFRITLDPASLQSDLLIVEDILISKPRIRYERQITTDNIKALQKEIEQATVRRKEVLGKETEPAELPTEVAESSGEAEGQKVMVTHLLIANGIVRAKLSALPAVPVPLPDIEIKDLGKEKGGTSLADAMTQIFNTFYDSLIGAVGNATGFAGDALKGVGALTFGAVGNVTEGVTGGLEQAVKGTEKTIEKAIDEVKKKKKGRGPGGRRRIL